MQNDKAKFKDEFKNRVYRFALDVIGFVDRLPVEQTSRIIPALKKHHQYWSKCHRGSGGFFKKGLYQFLCSCIEVGKRMQVLVGGLLRDSGRGNKGLINSLLMEATEIVNILASSILTLRGNR